MQNQRILIRLNADNNRINAGMVPSEHSLDLIDERISACTSRCSVVSVASATTMRVALGEVVRDEWQAAVTAGNLAAHPAVEHLDLEFEIHCK